MDQVRINQAGTRKAYSARGEQAQKMMSFRLDYENAEYLSTKPNKGRFINDLIAQARANDQNNKGSQ
ncbi:hypothetical protein [Ruminobacter sp.]|uniref:hypothetical protein n=1 Tax=Ruminobacter sp. TaxID=2774296 RepID=UPI0038699D98